MLFKTPVPPCWTLQISRILQAASRFLENCYRYFFQRVYPGNSVLFALPFLFPYHPFLNTTAGSIRQTTKTCCCPPFDPHVAQITKPFSLELPSWSLKVPIADRKEVKTVKRGCPKKENCANDVCRVCQTNLRVEYGSNTGNSFVNLFKPALRNETFDGFTSV